MNNELKLLVVDDQIEICTLLEYVFQSLNIKTYTATTIEETNQILSSIKPYAIFLDNNLPDGYGFELIPKIKSTFPSTKVIAMTAVDSSNAKEQALSSGADEFLEKPFSVSQIYKAVSDN